MKKEADRRTEYSREELKAFITDIEEKVVESNEAYLHSIVALNELLAIPNAADLFDDELKTRVRDLWIKLKSTGVQLSDPPLIFGLPEEFGREEEDEDLPKVG